MSLWLENGTIFAGRYKVLRRIASGGMGTVYEVMHVETERRRALKVMLPQIVQNADLRERFKREARVAARVDSEFIVDVFDAGVDDATGMPFLVMELLRGEELGKRLTRTGRLPPNEAVAYLQQTALALDKTHRAAIIHRDLKPENLFLTDREDGPPRIKVLDFGVAKLLADTVSTTMGRKCMGTPLYMSPEQYNPNIKVSEATDIYSLGMMAYTLLVGMAYWEDEAQRSASILSFAMIAVKGPKERPTARAARLGVRLPPSFDAWFSRATAIEPAARFQTATAAVSSLAEALGLAVAQGSVPPERVEALPSPPSGLSATIPAASDHTAVLGRPRAAPTPGASTTGWRADQRMGSIVAGAVVIGCMILSAALFFWWKHRASLSHGAENAAAVSPAVRSGALPAAPPAPPPPEPLPSARTSAEPEPREGGAIEEPSSSDAAKEPAVKPRPGRQKPPPRSRPISKPKRYSQD